MSASLLKKVRMLSFFSSRNSSTCASSPSLIEIGSSIPSAKAAAEIAFSGAASIATCPAN